MRYATLLMLVLIVACQARTATKSTRGTGTLDVGRLVPHDSADSVLLTPRVISEPAVVVFWLAAGDTLSVEEAASASDDMNYYTERIAPALKAYDIPLYPTNADTVYVALPNRQRRTILLTGLDYPFGYLLVDPGGVERILTGVYADDDLLDEIRAYFDLPEDTTKARPRITT